MERGVYFDGWFKHNHCYHPSLPIRGEQMLEDLEKYHATTLAWAGLGGGSISLPYLQHEAFGPVDPRMQIYGYMNDSEFIAECNSRGIKLFGIVFEVQGWEYPAVTDESGRIVRMNRRAQETEDHGWYGLREFSRGEYENAFPTGLKDYHPDGIRDEDGNPVTDLWEECCIRDMYGTPIHAQWVEVKGHEETCYQMCRNNPVWREYLKKIMMLQIDAGVPGIQLDECELPMTAIASGGCFCRSCMKQFREYLQGLDAEGKLSSAWDGIDLNVFDYGAYLRDHNSPFPKGAPFYREYWEFQVRQVRRYFGELADFARQYAKERYNRDLLISGNFYNMQPAYYPIEPKVDIVITEMEHTLFRQPYYYRYCAGFAPDKPVIIAENPYGGIIPRLLELLDRGKGYDLYRLFLLEASVYGCNMSVPYGGWMGNTVRDSFWAPRELTAQVQDFLYGHEDLFPKTRSAGAAVLYAYGSYYWRDSNKGSGANGMQDSYRDLTEATTVEWTDPDLKPVPFWDVVRDLSARNVQYDVILLPDGDLRPDTFTDAQLTGRPLVVVPDCNVLTENQCNALVRYAESGGRLQIFGRLAEGTDTAAKLSVCPGVRFTELTADRDGSMEAFRKDFDALYAPVCPVICDTDGLGIQRYDDCGCVILHILNYNWDADADRVVPLDRVCFTLKNVPCGYVRAFSLSGDGTQAEVCAESTADGVFLTVQNLPAYTVIELR